MNKETSTIKFVEAKHYSNKQITPKGAKLTEVLNQIKRYQEQVHNTSEEILEIYATYIEEILNRTFNINLPKPTKVDPKVTLLIFGFDSDQKKGNLKNIKQKISDHGIFVYAKGDIS